MVDSAVGLAMCINRCKVLWIKVSAKCPNCICLDGQPKHTKAFLPKNRFRVDGASVMGIEAQQHWMNETDCRRSSL